ncbi:MAG: NAD(+) synthase [Oligoflexales bacterium]|nr:NAD(+) synthase [Oligoflexales bacterium]
MKKHSLRDGLKIDAEREARRIVETIQNNMKYLHRKGAVLGISGGIDSSVCAALCAKALPGRVLGILMPEGESEDDSARLGKLLADALKIDCITENITQTLLGVGCYKRRNDAIRELVPEFTDEYKCKIVLPSVVEDDKLRVFSLVVQSPSGEIKKVRMSHKSYMTVVAASNFKQRARKMIEYFHADRLGYAVIGTPNRLEYDQGFFVKNGDGSADIKPIAHLYKTQVYEIAEALGVPHEIISRPPTTDTYSMPQSQEEFYFSLPYDRMDLCLYAYNNHVSAEDTASELGLSPDAIRRVFRDIASKRSTTRYGHVPPLLVEKVFDAKHFDDG